MSTKNLGSQILLTAVAFCLSTFAAFAQSSPAAKDVSDATIDANRDMAAIFARKDDQDFEFVQRVFNTKSQNTIIRDTSGKVVWNMDHFASQELSNSLGESVLCNQIMLTPVASNFSRSENPRRMPVH